MSSEKNPPQRPHTRAVAIQYTQVDELPKVVASGAGEIARKIIELAEKNEVPVMQDGALSEMLSNLSSGEAISPESFELVAEVICFLYEMDTAWRKQHPQIGAVIGAEAGALPGSGEN